MGRRQHKRYRIALPVTISGVDANGNRFAQSATTVDIGVNGVQLGGVRCLRTIGDQVEVQYKDRRARYRVAWIGAPGTDSDGRVGLRGVEAAQNLFANHLPQFPASVEPDTYVIPTAVIKEALASDHAAIERREASMRVEPERRQQERRRHPRFNCAGTATMLENGSAMAISGRLNELSLGGCYIEMMSPLRAGTSMKLDLDVGGRRVKVDGVVRTSQPTFGMGVEFMRMDPTEAEKLHVLVSELGGGAQPANPPPNVQANVQSAAAPAVTPSANEIGEAVLRWFGTHDTLSRDEFRKLTHTAAREQTELTHA